MFRRAVCSIPTNSLNKTFATFRRHLKKDRYLESVKAHFLLLPSYRRFPQDDEFKRDLQLRDVYNFRSRSYWLRRLENQGRKERVPTGEYTIEHIMPQNKDLSAQWQIDLGPDWQQIHEKYLHTLGNLTLTRYNSEYSDRPFAEKRDMEGGFKVSPLKLNEGIGTLERWDERAIKARAEFLASRASKVWVAVHLPEERLAEYRTQPEQAPGTSLHDRGPSEPQPRKHFPNPVRRVPQRGSRNEPRGHRGVPSSSTWPTRRRPISWTSSPQASRLRLSLNMSFQELHDPRGLARDMTNLGMWGNGDVDVMLSDLGELRYVMALVRQAFERQMGNGESET